MEAPISGGQLLLGALGMLFSSVAGFAAAYVLMIWKFSDLAQRLSRVEGFIETVGGEAFSRLHRDDDKYGLDYYVNKYKEHHCDLPMEDWMNVLAICEHRLESNTGGADTPYFIFVKALAVHKLSAGGITYKPA